jgi:hypothetical protein
MEMTQQNLDNLNNWIFVELIDVYSTDDNKFAY